jgi:hypothetical protein
MKRIALLCVVGGSLLVSSGCDQIKRKTEDAMRAEKEKAADRLVEGVRKKAVDTEDAAVNKASGEDSSPEAKKRDKLKGHSDDDQ